MSRFSFARSCAIPSLGALLVSGCATIYTAPPIPDPDKAPELYAPALASEYRIRVGDQLALRSYHDAELNQEMIVRPDGKISVMLIGEMPVAGMTPAALQDVIAKTYARKLDAPDLTVVVKQSADASVYVGGEVRSPSVLPATGTLSLRQALTAAGGSLVTADLSQVLIMRRNDSGNIVASKIDVASALRANTPDLYLRQNDIVYVPKLGIAEAGDVVELYVNRMIPRSILFQFGFVKSLDDDSDSSLLLR